MSKSKQRKLVVPGVYHHFKGKYYAVMGLSKPLNGEDFWRLYRVFSPTYLCIKHTERPSDYYIPLFMLNSGECFHLSDAEDKELVVYKSLYDNGPIYVRPYDMFMGEVDKVKYPKINQKHRFEFYKGEE